jgi:hypothetical protein
VLDQDPVPEAGYLPAEERKDGRAVCAPVDIENIGERRGNIDVLHECVRGE